MGNHRADVAPDVTSSVTPPPETRGYVGKRRAAVPVDDAPVHATAPGPYVGKRRASTPVDDLRDEPIARPLPTRVVLREQPQSRGPVEAPEGRLGDALVEDARITTAEIQAIVDAALQDTAPRPRIRFDDLPPVVTVPAQRHDEHPDVRRDADAQTAPEPEAPAEQLFRETSTDSLINLPRISVAATYAADLSGEPTALLPAVTDSRRRVRTTRMTARHRRPSMPVIAGVAATLAAIGGAVVTAHPGLAPASDTRVTGASALTGTTVSDTVGSTTGRSDSVSRDDDRTAQSEAKDAADARARALGNLDQEAAGQQKYLNSNRWDLPIEPHVYHLTGRFGDVSGLWATIHTGLDFAAAYGTPIHAVARGVVTEVGWGGAYGNRTIVTLPDGTEIWYCHQSQFGTSVGDTVDEGEVIGYVGATGNVTGPHVHIEVRPGGGDPVDPDAAFKAHGVDPDAEQ